MKKFVFLLTAMTLALMACEKEDNPFSPGNHQGVSSQKDPALSWNADSFEATIGTETVFPTLANTYKVNVTYASSQPDVAAIDGSGAITLVSAGSTLITASYAADDTYSSSSASYSLVLVTSLFWSVTNTFFRPPY